MKKSTFGIAITTLLISVTAACADTALMFVTPQNIKSGTFTLTSKAARNNAVEFVIRRDISKIDGSGTAGYVSNRTADGKGLGTPVKPEEKKGKLLTFRFSVPTDKIEGTVFTLWGHGLGGEGVTYEFRLADFWKPKTD